MPLFIADDRISDAKSGFYSYQTQAIKTSHTSNFSNNVSNLANSLYFCRVCYRLLSFWDTRDETLIVATHGIVKKTQKTPKKEITKAETLRKEYFDNN